MKRPGFEWIGVVGETILVMTIVLLVTMVIGEIVIRVIRPVPKVQVIRPERIDLFCEDDIPIWVQESTRMNLECVERHPDADIVVFSGDSIFFGSLAATSEVFTKLIQDRIDRVYGKGLVCVVNLSQPAYSIEQKVYWLDRLMEKRTPVHVFWEAWPNESGRFRKIGDSVYNFAGTDGDRGRLPGSASKSGKFGVWLFSHSRLVEYAVLALAENDNLSKDWIHDEYRSFLVGLRDRLRKAGSGFTLVVATSLARPFDELESDLKNHQNTFVSVGRQIPGLNLIRLDAMFRKAGLSHTDVRADECCHFNATGHAAMAGYFTPVVEKLVRDSVQARKADK